jgi:hypothetical protein
MGSSLGVGEGEAAQFSTARRRRHAPGAAFAAFLGGLGSAAAAKEMALAEVEMHFDACERILPPHAACEERFAVLDPARLMLQQWKLPERTPAGAAWHPDALDFAYAQQFRIVGPFSARSIWAIYEKAWFGAATPADWFRELCMSRLYVEAQARRNAPIKRGKEPPPFTRQNARDWAKLTKKQVEEAVQKLAPGTGEPGMRGGLQPFLGAPQLVAMFLAHGQADLKAKFQPSWATLLPTYADLLRTAEDDEAATAACLRGIDRKELAQAMMKWAKQRAK